jgi:hypothetical protein
MMQNRQARLAPRRFKTRDEQVLLISGSPGEADHSFRIANLFVEMMPMLPALEMTLLGPTLNLKLRDNRYLRLRRQCGLPINEAFEVAPEPPSRSG